MGSTREGAILTEKVCLSCLSKTVVYCGQTVRWIKMKLGTQVGLGPVHIVLDGDQAVPPQRVTARPQFSAYICCGQMAGWIKISLGRDVGLGPSDIVSDGDPAPAPRRRGQSPPIFGPCLLWPNGWVDQGATWCGGRPRPGQHCVRCGPSSIPKGHRLPNFRPISVAAKRLEGSRCHLVRR